MRSRQGISLFAVVLIVACSAPPEEKRAAVLEAANQSVLLEAEAYAPDEWDRADAALDAAEEELARQEARLPLFRSYGRAGQLLDDAMVAVDEANQQAGARRDEMTIEVGSALTGLQGDLDVAETLLSDLGRCRALMSSEPLELLADEHLAIRDACDEVEADLAADAVFEAWTASQELSDECERFLAELDALAESSGCLN